MDQEGAITLRSAATGVGNVVILASRLSDAAERGDILLSQRLNAAVGAGAKVINMSLGGSQPSGQLMNALQNAVNHGVIIVISAGNDGEEPEGVNPDPFALVPAQFLSGNNVIIAGALNGTATDIAPFSNRAGTGADWYLMALGTLVNTIDQNGRASQWSGTSFSAAPSPSRRSCAR